MTARQVWEGMLTELSKVNAPSMLLQDFNYFFNKAINQYINKRYNIYDINQQTTDDLRVLKSTAFLDVNKVTTISPYLEMDMFSAGKAKIFGATYETIMPPDYLHLLNCICIYKVKKNFKCYNAGDYVQFAAKRLTADSWSVVINDYYNRPLPWRPYFYIHNVNINNTLPTNPITEDNPNGTDVSAKYSVTINDKPENNGGVEEEPGRSNFPRTIKLGQPFQDTNISTVERETAMRYGNASNVRLEVRYGSDDSIFELQKLFVDYIKVPQVIRLTQEQVDLIEDTSQIMEFPDYVCQEIINELTMLVMENTADPRLQTNTIVTQSIANPAQQQTSQLQPQRKG